MVAPGPRNARTRSVKVKRRTGSGQDSAFAVRGAGNGTVSSSRILPLIEFAVLHGALSFDLVLENS